MGGTVKRGANLAAYAGASAGALALALAAAFVTGAWVLTALPVGFLFGFLLQKGDLCGASAFSEVLLLRSGQKIWGLWVWIVTGMAGLAALDLLGWAVLAPKGFIWVNYLAGGLVFGAGSILAGGCVSGSLFKAGVGHLSSMAALPGIALGVAAVEYGPLHALYAHCRASYRLAASDGGPVTLSSLTGLPFWLLAAVIAGATIAAALLSRRSGSRRARESAAKPGKASRAGLLARRSWKPWHAGLALGVLTAVSLLSSAASGRNYPLGVTHGVLHAQLLVTDSNLKHVWRTAPPSAPPGDVSAAGRKTVSWWLIAEVLSLAAGAWVAARMSGEARLYPKPPEQLVVAFFGGILVGSGAAFAEGCFIGNMTSGWALMSVGTVLFGVAAILANLAATWFYLIGGTLFGSDG